MENKPNEPKWIKNPMTGECPVPAGDDVEVMFYNGGVGRDNEPEYRGWGSGITHYRNWTAWEREQTKDSGSASKTVTVNGKVYEIGKFYTSKCVRFPGKLISHDGRDFRLDLSGNTWFCDKVTEVPQESLGTIKGAPMELEEGEWYMVKHENGEVCPYLYIKNGWRSISDDCNEPEIQLSKLKPLYKMVKA